MGGLRGPLPQLWPTLDPKCRWRVSCLACRDGTDICWPREGRGDRRAGRGKGRTGSTRHRPYGGIRATRSVRRIQERRDTRRSKPMVGNKRRRKGSWMMRKTSLIILGAAAGAALTLISTQPRIVFDGSSAKAAAADTYRQLSLFGDVFERVRSDYVEKPEDSKLVESAINGMLAGLDPHSSYMDSKSFRDMQVQTRGEFGGLGIEVTMEDGLIKVVAPIDETPAAKAGVMANDIITHLDDEPVQGLTLNQAVEKMRGPVNT